MGRRPDDEVVLWRAQGAREFPAMAEADGGSRGEGAPTAERGKGGVGWLRGGLGVLLDDLGVERGG